MNFHRLSSNFESYLTTYMHQSGILSFSIEKRLWPLENVSENILHLSTNKTSQPSNMKKSYVQASKSNLLRIKNIVWVKKVFPALLVDEVGKVLKIKNNREDNKKPRINMMTREPSRKEVIILMVKHIAELIVNSAHIYITNVNKCLKNSKSDIITDFIRSTNNEIIITINKPANNLNLSTIEKYLKNIQNVILTRSRALVFQSPSCIWKSLDFHTKSIRTLSPLTLLKMFSRKPTSSTVSHWPQNLMSSKHLLNQTWR